MFIIHCSTNFSTTLIYLSEAVQDVLCRSVLASGEDWFHTSRSVDSGLNHIGAENSWKLQHHKLLCDGMPKGVTVKNHTIALMLLLTS